jgi:hypothetical protein
MSHAAWLSDIPIPPKRAVALLLHRLGLSHPRHLHVLRQLKEGFPCPLLFQQDGTLPHYNSDVRDFLDEQLATSNVERGGSTPWSAVSVDLSSLYLFFGSFVSTPHQCHSPWQRYGVESQMLQRTWKKFWYGLDILKLEASTPKRILPPLHGIATLKALVCLRQMTWNCRSR